MSVPNEKCISSSFQLVGLSCSVVLLRGELPRGSTDRRGTPFGVPRAGFSTVPDRPSCSGRSSTEHLVTSEPRAPIGGCGTQGFFERLAHRTGGHQLPERVTSRQPRTTIWCGSVERRLQRSAEVEVEDVHLARPFRGLIHGRGCPGMDEPTLSEVVNR